MNKKIILSVILFCSIFTSQATSSAKVMDKVFAVVNDELITQAELDRILIPIYKQYKTMYKGEELILKMDEVRRDVLNQMIIDKLILYEARRQGIEVQPREINRKIEELKNRFSSEEEFQQALMDQGVAPAELQKKFEDELLKEKFIDREIRRKIVITPTEISEHYSTNIDKFEVPPQARVLNIFIKPKENEDKNKTFSRANDILERLKQGEDFSEVAKTHSDGSDAKNGGDMEYISKWQLKKELDEAIFSLKAGELSDVVESNIGYHIFMVLDKKDQTVIKLEEVYDKIRDIIYRQKVQTKFNELIGDLKKNAYISIK